MHPIYALSKPMQELLLSFLLGMDVVRLSHVRSEALRLFSLDIF